MREIFLGQLTKNLLGPRDGIREIMDSRHKPILEYITGILAPVHDLQTKTVKENRDGSQMPITESKSFEGDSTEDAHDSQYILDPTLNPEKIPAAMGISFQVSYDSTPDIEICLTWARYHELKNKSGQINWERHPRYSILKVTHSDETEHYVDSTGKICEKENAEVRFVSRIKKLDDGKYFVSIFMINCANMGNEKNTLKYYIFQPQIRILCVNPTKLIQMTSTVGSDRDDKLELDEFLFRKKQSFARGHMTSAVWWDVDPENIPDHARVEFGDAVKDIPFKWLDGEIVPKEIAEKFAKPDIRTEYIPIYSIPSPSIDWHDDNDAPVLEANECSDMWDAEKLRKSFEPLHRQYLDWISNLDHVKDGTNDNLVDQIQNQCIIVHSRICDGIEKLATDDDARLAFCFANKAMDQQSIWSRNQGMKYRPFQLAFVLMSLESIINPKSKFRDVCDLLWVPTGTGKTEAYLALVAISMSYRRLKELKRSKSGAGVDVISRYTLRLLTIQQFRRCLSLFTAAETLRVVGLSEKNPIGWRPKGFTRNDNLIWGSTPFSVGLWVGASVTPNRLKDGRMSDGALKLLNTHPKNSKSDGEPAQVLECPACGNLLAVPEMGLEADPPKPHEINWVVKTNINQSDISGLKFENIGSIKISKLDLQELNGEYNILSVTFTNTLVATTKDVFYMWKKIEEKIIKEGKNISYECTSPSRPGYFYRMYMDQKNKLKEYDFQIFCTKKQCPLDREWMGGTLCGQITHSVPDPNDIYKSTEDITLDDGNNLIEIIPCFRKSQYISLRIPINGLTVDDQVYRTAPTMIISTVDKFARLPFEPQAGILFGNIQYSHILYGHYRYNNEHLSPEGRTLKYYREIGRNEILRPSFIIQDELHLLEGPLGSMTGIYESCIDFLARSETKNTKYIASSATIKSGHDQVRSLFAKELQIFPPHGTDIDDRFFIKEKEKHALFDSNSGRLYMGILSPGKGALTPIIRIWSSLAQTGFDNQNNSDIDRFWTITGYFNAVRELAGAKALYRQDIPERIRDFADNPRPLDPDKVHELSGRTASNDLPSILNRLARKYPDAADGLLTTSMFGTGVDISRIGIMLVVGQPKTTSSYIQSTGRVGRSKGGLVPVFFRASRPRDLSHYEYFMRNHRQLHRTVESSAVNPFSSSAVDRSLGPIIIGILRNMRMPTIPWSRRNSAPRIQDNYTVSEILQLSEFMEHRSQNQPINRRPKKNTIQDATGNRIGRWKQIAEDVDDLEYVEYEKAENSVVLGDPIHEKNKDCETVFANSPQSMRDLEEETGFQT